LLRHFRKSRNGAAALEFALLLPLLITMFFGLVETTLALLCRADVSVMASTACNLISQESAASNTDLSKIYSAAGTILYPHYNPGVIGSAKPTIRVTSVIYDPISQSTTFGKVAWTCTQTGSGTLSPSTRNINDTVTLPQALMTTNGRVIIAEIAYNYGSRTTKVITDPISMANNFYLKPRRVAQITAPSSRT
jgi:Flp pilus assembly protein TadG